ncbi:glutathione-dependent formaldehyde dehydrogenase [Chlorella sorokiniana]|uniref:Glutathione-dependent formaldehyde dehydrogenase n=1 Tax=Chlorella sorokiniana TaxID=3076 RepID=A0A2P6TW27_CHLSO|nr:glutathione-dependent formaldehyde dehydrogenase [Chlorella sorokiniana]|eukprot:PRW58268.1 glutathione-dependent formaldehyde dehydrogenase [Chlorella sorokiniana]
MTSIVNAMLPRHTEAPAATIQGKKDESRKMKTAQWFGTKDVVLRVTSTAICGSDLHLYTNAMPGMKKGDILGHEFIFFGYTHLTGGWDGGQAEYVRVPYADLNCLKVLLSDILPTAWHSNELGEVGPGDRVAIWGAGPVGLLAAHCAFARGAERVILIDKEEFRLKFAKERISMGRLETINFSQKKPYEALREMFPDGTGPDVCIEAVGLHYTNSWQTALKLETDPSDILNELIECCRKGGRIAVAGAYAGYCNHFNIGAFMEKCLTMRAGQTPVQKYWCKLLQMIEQGKLDPTFVITHRPMLEQASEAYRMFNDKTHGCIKVVMKLGKKETAGKTETAGQTTVAAS